MQRKLMGLLALVLGSAFAQTSIPAAEDDPAVWAARSQRAASLRVESNAMRNAADAQREKDDVVCRKRFFENACKDSARDRWIVQINKVRALEIEAVGLERNLRAYEQAMKEKARASNPLKPSLVLPLDAAAKTEPVPASAPSALPMSAGAPKPAAKPPLNKADEARKRAAEDAKSAQTRAHNAQQAAVRAEQAKKDAARYEERAKQYAQKEAERQAKKVGAEQSVATAPASPAK